MKSVFILLAFAMCPFSAFAVEDSHSKLWTDGKITPDQPFKAKVVAAGGLSPWSGETVLYLREDLEEGRYLEVRISIATGRGVLYTPIKNKKVYDEIIGSLDGYGAAVFLDPVDISRFVWASPLGGVGQIFGDTDLVKKAIEHSSKNENQASTSQPETQQESKSEDGK